MKHLTREPCAHNATFEYLQENFHVAFLLSEFPKEKIYDTRAICVL